MFCGGLPLLSQFFFPPDLGFRVNGCSFGVYINWDYAAHLHKGWFPQKTWQAGAVSDTRGCRGAQGGEARNAARRDPGPSWGCWCWKIKSGFAFCQRAICRILGAAFFSQTVAVNDATVKFEIWDTAGQERYHSLAPMYYRGAAAAIIVYDITNQV
ncbi:uncharacterized protein LOC108214836 [Daucus carota subsp. sativus]|uniref:uncharacterized protein LOC108214836 n=1 Tax=Daucus carota subsp. sativus TaxID=79200 RepID=UPI0030832FCE